MTLKHITGHVYAHPDNIAKIEGFPLTLLIRVTLRDGSVHERFVTEMQLFEWTDPEQCELRRNRLIDLGIKNPMSKIHTREEAFARCIQDYISYIDRAERYK